MHHGLQTAICYEATSCLRSFVYYVISEVMLCIQEQATAHSWDLMGLCLNGSWALAILGIRTCAPFHFIVGHSKPYKVSSISKLAAVRQRRFFQNNKLSKYCLKIPAFHIVFANFSWRRENCQNQLSQLWFILEVYAALRNKDKKVLWKKLLKTQT